MELDYFCWAVGLVRKYWLIVLINALLWAGFIHFNLHRHVICLMVCFLALLAFDISYAIYKILRYVK